jgi:predicted DNA-binding transcriptional regulator AlpA
MYCGTGGHPTCRCWPLATLLEPWAVKVWGSLHTPGRHRFPLSCGIYAESQLLVRIDPDSRRSVPPCQRGNTGDAACRYAGATQSSQNLWQPGEPQASTAAQWIDTPVLQRAPRFPQHAATMRENRSMISNESVRMSDEVLTLHETAALTKVAPQTLRNWRWRGQGPPSFLVGGSLRYRRSAVEQWLAEQERAELERQIHQPRAG